MKQQVSEEETGLKITYILASSVPISIGAMSLFFVYFSDHSMAKEDSDREIQTLLWWLI